MYARMIQFRIPPEKIDQAVRVYRDSVVPVAEKQPGFQGAFLLTDRAGGRAMSISLWTSQEAMQAGETTGFVEAQVAKFAGLVAGSPTLEAFEVSAVTVKVQ